jgi:hypothetical protein
MRGNAECRMQNAEGMGRDGLSEDRNQELGAWSLELGVGSLELGAWSSELGAWTGSWEAWSLSPHRAVRAAPGFESAIASILLIPHP